MYRLLVLIVLITACNCEVPSCQGCVSLDEYSLYKVLYKFRATLIKYDVVYPYGEKHDVFVKFSGELTHNTDILLGEINIKSYGAKENELFARSIGVNTTDLPSIRLYLASADDQVVFEEQEFNLENLRKFVRKHTGIYWLLPGCVEEFDELAMNLMDGTGVDYMEKIIKDAKWKLEELTDQDDYDAGKAYVAYMKKVVANGKEFIKTEQGRLEKLLSDAKISERKRDELLNRVNILQSFRGGAKDEL